MTIDECFALLKAAGWSIGDIGTASGWLVTGSRGGHVIKTYAPTRGAAWCQAVEEARRFDEPEADPSIIVTLPRATS
jgi:hypothetical protein